MLQDGNQDSGYSYPPRHRQDCAGSSLTSSTLPPAGAPRTALVCVAGSSAAVLADGDEVHAFAWDDLLEGLAHQEGAVGERDAQRPVVGALPLRRVFHSRVLAIAAPTRHDCSPMGRIDRPPLWAPSDARENRDERPPDPAGSPPG